MFALGFARIIILKNWTQNLNLSQGRQDLTHLKYNTWHQFAGFGRGHYPNKGSKNFESPWSLCLLINWVVYLGMIGNNDWNNLYQRIGEACPNCPRNHNRVKRKKSGLGSCHSLGPKPCQIWCNSPEVRCVAPCLPLRGRDCGSWTPAMKKAPAHLQLC